ncbi:heme ABC exporter ATP-binding protein CcmA [Hwanghaeella grinnelliae]|uniref:Heme ABC exporter ATP-binding protein CcmA n=1 Tax=Hwanghaeella grinnelliae TaxID=2500179 RepID=A0A437QPW8_9PROT|nr:heme ABC exporter ATP-binding protein CcmA [Hwanghaeella grinnelliae]RVU36507.1 heme ABC exporter ATP-binding protein CcmA [Hwanghaeella grinnelliae]
MASFSGTDISCIRGGRLVFDGLSFSVSSGGALLLTGPNGSGKSTLLRLMAGLIPPTLGALAWDDVPVDQDPEDHRARLHYLAHAEAVKPPLTVAEDLSFWQALSGSDKPVSAAIDAMGLETQSALPGRYLSAGQRRRLALARLLVSETDLWLLDEPSVGLDTASLAKLRSAIADHRAAGGIVVAATHVDLGLDGAETLSINQFAVDPAQMSAL